MMHFKKLCLLCLLVTMVFTARADHITGGEMYYTFISESNGQYNYSIVLKLFMF